MKKLLCLSFLLLSNCGEEPFLIDGIYKVDINFVRSDWQILDGIDEEKLPVQWYIEETKDGWHYEVVGGSTQCEGIRKDNKIIFYKENKNTPGFVDGTFELIVIPNKDGDKFKGTGRIESLIGEATFITEITHKGKLISGE